MRKRLAKNQTEIVYVVSSGIPFRWECKVEDESIAKFVEKYIKKNENRGAICGAPVHYSYVFEGLKEGTTKIIFEYYNFADNYVDEKEEYTCVVDSKNRITISR